MTIEHALYYAGRQLSEMWAYVPLCWYHHLGKGLNKEMNKYLAMRQMTSEDIGNAYVDYPKFDWIAVRDRLLKKYGRSD